MVQKSFPVDVVMTCAGRYAFFERLGDNSRVDFLNELKQVCEFLVQTPLDIDDVQFVAAEVAPFIIDQHPWIADMIARLCAIDDREARCFEVDTIVAEVMETYGAEIELHSLPDGAVEVLNTFDDSPAKGINQKGVMLIIITDLSDDDYGLDA